MTEMWQSLIEVLDEMQALYQRLLELSGEKKDLLIQARPGELEALNRLEESLVIEGSELEHRRAKATAVIVTTCGLSNTSPTLSELTAVAEPAAAERLNVFSRDFGATLKDLARLNSVNAKLTEKALGFVNYNLNLLTRSQAENTYAPVGTAPMSRATSALLDRKV